MAIETIRFTSFTQDSVSSGWSTTQSGNAYDANTGTYAVGGGNGGVAASLKVNTGRFMGMAAKTHTWTDAKLYIKADCSNVYNDTNCSSTISYTTDGTNYTTIITNAGDGVISIDTSAPITLSTSVDTTTLYIKVNAQAIGATAKSLMIPSSAQWLLWEAWVEGTYSTGPTVSNLNNSSYCNIGSTYNITGTGFTGTTAVSINGVSASFSVTNATTISVTIPAMSTYGAITVSVTNGSAATCTGYINTPTISISTPATGGSVFNSSTTTCTATVTNLASTTINWTCSAGSFSPTSTTSGGSTTWTAPASPSPNGQACTLFATAAGNSSTYTSVGNRYVYFVPTVTSFTSSPANGSTSVNGTIAYLTWATSNASSTTTNFGSTSTAWTGLNVGVINSNGSTTYTITPVNAGGSGSASSITVNALPYPSMTSFTSSPTSGGYLTNGSNFYMSWTTINATSVSHTNFPVSPNAYTSYSGWTIVGPPANTTTTYYLAAVNAAATSSNSSVTVTMVAAPVISSYGADTYNLITGHSTGIRMSFSSATVARIGTSGSGGTEVTASAVSGTTYTVSPTVTTTYYFYVANAAGSTSTSSFTITVYPVATLVNNGPILLNGTVTLTTVFSVGTGSLSVPTVAPGTWGTWATGTGQTVALPYNKLYTLTQNTAGQSPTSDTIYNIPQAKMPTTASSISLSQARQITTGGGTAANYDMNNATIRTLAGAGGSGTSISFSQLSGKSLGTGTYFT